MSIIWRIFRPVTEELSIFTTFNDLKEMFKKNMKSSCHNETSESSQWGEGRGCCLVQTLIHFRANYDVIFQYPLSSPVPSCLKAN